MADRYLIEKPAGTLTQTYRWVIFKVDGSLWAGKTEAESPETIQPDLALAAGQWLSVTKLEEKEEPMLEDFLFNIVTLDNGFTFRVHKDGNRFCFPYSSGGLRPRVGRRFRIEATGQVWEMDYIPAGKPYGNTTQFEAHLVPR